MRRPVPGPIPARPTDRGRRSSARPSRRAAGRCSSSRGPNTAGEPGDRAGRRRPPAVRDEPVIRSSSRLKSSRRSDCEVTRWLQPAHADRGAPRPWARSSTSAPIPHRNSRSEPPMDLITTSTSPPRGIPVRGDRPQGQPSADFSTSKRRDSDTCSHNIHRWNARFKTATTKFAKHRVLRDKKEATTKNTNSHG